MESFTYHQAIAYLESLPTPAHWSLDTPRRLNGILGIAPACQILHVTGTNGKGSACAFASEILRRAGYNTGMYTSPHLLEYRERMQVNGKQISGPDFASAVGETSAAIEKMRKTDGITPSSFEALTSAALLHFQRRRLDFLVMEAGMGGRLDATNAVDAQAALITNIGLEHTLELGGTLAKIAREKAGIIKPHAKAVTGCCQPQALREIQLAAKNNRASLKVLGKDFSYRVKSVSLDATEFDYSGTSSFPGLRSPLLGRHQAFNASCAIAAVECFRELGFNIPENAVRAGIADAEWPGRLEIMRRNPLVIVDGAHNPDGVKALRAALRDLLPGKKPVFVLGILADKDFRRMISLLAPIASRMIFCRPATPRAADPEVLAQEARKAGCSNVAIIPKVSDAVRQAIAVSAASDAVVVAGSLYTAGEARSALSARL